MVQGEGSSPWIENKHLEDLEQFNTILFICLLDLIMKTQICHWCVWFFPLYFSMCLFLLHFFFQVLVHSRLKFLKPSFEMLRNAALQEMPWIWNLKTWTLVSVSSASDSPPPPTANQGNLVGHQASLGWVTTCSKWSDHQRSSHI